MLEAAVQNTPARTSRTLSGNRLIVILDQLASPVQPPQIHEFSPKLQKRASRYFLAYALEWSSNEHRRIAHTAWSIYFTCCHLLFASIPHQNRMYKHGVLNLIFHKYIEIECVYSETLWDACTICNCVPRVFDFLVICIHQFRLYFGVVWVSACMLVRFHSDHLGTCCCVHNEACNSE